MSGRFVSGMLASGEPLGELDGGDDARVRSASADVALHGAADFGFRGMRRFAQQSGGGHDHARRAVSALHGVGLDEGLLERRELAVGSETFDGGDLLSGDAGGGRDAGSHGRAIDEDGAGAALAFAAAVLAAGEFEIVAQDPEEFAVGVDLKPVMLLIDDQFHTLILRAGRLRGESGGGWWEVGKAQAPPAAR